MAKPGDPNYRGPVHEGWGRDLHNLIGDIDAGARDIAGSVASGVQSGLDTISGIFNQPAQGSSNPTKRSEAHRGTDQRTDNKPGGGFRFPWE